MDRVTAKSVPCFSDSPAGTKTPESLSYDIAPYQPSKPRQKSYLHVLLLYYINHSSISEEELDKSLPMLYLLILLDYLRVPWIIQAESLRSYPLDTWQISRHKEKSWSHVVSCSSNLFLPNFGSEGNCIVPGNFHIPAKVFFYLNSPHPLWKF